MPRPIAVSNLTRNPPPRIGPKFVAVPLSFAAADTDANFTFRFDLTQEMMQGQFATPQMLYLDNTAGAVDVQLWFQATNQYLRIPLRSLAILPFLGHEFGPCFARYQSSDWNLFPGFADAAYKPTLYVLNTPMPYGIWSKPLNADKVSVTNYNGTLAIGGNVTELIYDSVDNGIVPETRIAVYIENPADEVEPLFWRVQGSANATRARLLPGEHIILGAGWPLGQGSLQLAGATIGHAYKVYLWSLL